LAGTAYQVLLGEKSPGDLLVRTPLDHLLLLPANIDLIGAEVELVGTERREERLRIALEGFRDRFEYVLIDCPPSLGLLTVNALTAADGVIIPLQCEYYALEGLSQLVNTIHLIREGYNPALSIRGIVMTMFDGRTNLSQQVMEEVRGHFPGRVFRSVIPRNIKLGEAPSFGKPILLYDIRSRGAEAYLELAKEVIGGG
jgi:chromosome partitioning protein